jgi:ATP-binding cassette subfamily B protein
MSAFGASGRIFELLEKPIEEREIGKDSLHQGMIEFKDVTFSYPARLDFPILKGVNFSIAPHETVAIVGPSGSGKSTIVQLLMRFYEPNSGQIFFDNEDSKKYSLKGLRTSIGLVSQEPVLVSESIFENIRYGKPSASEDEVLEAARKAFAHDFITSFPDGYNTLVGERGVQLSGGQKQRVAIARAILKNPRILILDEATSSLDAESEHLVQKALEDQMGQRSTLVIAHRLSTVKRADKILVLQEGKIIQMGTHLELYKDEQGLYHKLVERQFNDDKEIK